MFGLRERFDHVEKVAAAVVVAVLVVAVLTVVAISWKCTISIQLTFKAIIFSV